MVPAEIEQEIEQERVMAATPDERISPNRSTISSYAAMTDPDEGASLNFVHTPVVNAVKCAKIDPKMFNPKLSTGIQQFCAQFW